MLFVLLLSLIAGAGTWSPVTPDALPLSVTQDDVHKSVWTSRATSRHKVDETNPDSPPLIGPALRLVIRYHVVPRPLAGLVAALRPATVDASSYNARAPPVI
jgi:hypothetical protein